MREFLLLRLQAPLMSFGAPLVDQHGFTLRFPGRAMLAGLLGNALGYAHSDFDKLERLQRGLSYAVRQDRAEVPLLDFQTVFLGRSHMRQGGWTTWGKAEERGGASPEETHIRYRHYLADAAYTVAIETSADAPSLAVLEQALRTPSRPLFLGRKACLPSAPLLMRPARTQAETVLSAVEQAPLAAASGREQPERRMCWWPDTPELPKGERLIAVTDDRDWSNQIHVGRRYIHEGLRPIRATAQTLEARDAG